MALTQVDWTPIIDKVTTGNEVATNLLQAFNIVDTAIEKINDIDAGISTHPTTLYLAVINNSGVTIPAGRVVRTTGAVAGFTYVAMAQADTFENARILGITTTDIASGGSGEVVTSGKWGGNTTGYSVGVPLYLSSTTPGTLVTTAPTIASQVGTCLLAETVGQLIVTIENNIVFPAITSLLMGQTSPTYSLTTTKSSLVNYITNASILGSADAALGTITFTSSGLYKLEIQACCTFATDTAARILTLDVVNTATDAVVASCSSNLGKEFTAQALDIHKFINLSSGTYILKARTSVSMDITFTNLDFSATSISLSV